MLFFFFFFFLFGGAVETSVSVTILV